MIRPALAQTRRARRLIVVGGGLAGAVVAAAAASAAALRLRRPPRVARAVIVDPARSTTVSRSGAVRSVQAADLTLPSEALDRIWTPMHLERLARTYWRFITRATLGVIGVRYTPQGRELVVLARPFSLLSFHEPEYEMGPRRGLVRWRIAKGLLVSRAGRGEGYLQIDVERREDSERSDCAVVHVEVEVSNFYPAIASSLSTWVYRETQSRIHVLVTHGFLRSLARLDLAESVIGRYAQRLAGSTPPGRVQGRGWRPLQRVAAQVALGRGAAEGAYRPDSARAPAARDRETAGV